MADLLAVVTLNHVSGIPRDGDQNGWVFNAPAAPQGAVDAINLLVDFYNDIHAPGIFSIGSRISPEVSRVVDAHTIEVYDITAFLDGSPHGSPFAMANWTLDDASSATLPLPTEAAVVLSFHADLAGVPEESGLTRPRARRRGRVYIGPINANGIETGARIEDQLRIAVNAGGDFVMDDTTVEWRVWSRADAVTREVVGGHVDNAWDTQRRRGQDSTERSVFGT